MNGAKWVLMAFMATSAMSSVARIGQPVKPWTPSLALGTLIMLGVLAWMVVLA